MKKRQHQKLIKKFSIAQSYVLISPGENGKPEASWRNFKLSRLKRFLDFKRYNYLKELDELNVPNDSLAQTISIPVNPKGQVEVMTSGEVLIAKPCS